MNVRSQLAMVRDATSTPTTILPTGERVGVFAHIHLQSQVFITTARKKKALNVHSPTRFDDQEPVKVKRAREL